MLQIVLGNRQSDRRRWWRGGGTGNWRTTGGMSGLTGIVAASVLALLPAPASAHIKWFMPYDVTRAPTAVGDVLTLHFLVLLVIFALLVSGGFMLDRGVIRRWKVLAAPTRWADVEEQLLRAGMGGFFMALFATGGLILTPELHTDADWPAWLQFGIAISLLSARSCIVAGLGIVILFVYGAVLYGVFHLADYPVFLGIAAYFVLTPVGSERLCSFRMPILYVSLCISLMWGAIEKWAYPQWTLSLLELRPYLTAGFAHDDFLVFAGFVEFALSFYILVGFSLVRPAILGLLGIFGAAVLDFGKVDAIGHLPIVVPLMMMFIHGPCRLHIWIHKTDKTAIGDGHRAGVAFATSICLLFAAYYGLHYAEYGHGVHQTMLASHEVAHLH